ncbi:MAG: hypothetical protein CVU89_13575 [Firmicutes bacterium HGW-Firmicutes-14]|nr:MAG: hypothetical protein CVU89_13575 [Firmicutes bacterium HGW-Firmicutes-14]
MQYSLKNTGPWMINMNDNQGDRNNDKHAELMAGINSERLRPSKGILLGIGLSAVIWLAVYGIYALLFR